MRIQLQDEKEWHEWFAWHPVWVNRTVVWMENVERRWIPNASSSGDFSGYTFDVAGWEYR